MNKSYKIIFFCSLFFFVAHTAFTQQNRFVYIQTENKQPFYIKLNNKLLSSSVSGYLIIPKLQAGNYQLTIGFPKNEWPEQSITCTVNKKDEGYLLKEFDDKGWGLFNLQTREVLMPGNASVNDKAIVAGDKKAPVVIATPNIVTADSAITKITTENPAINKEEAKEVTEVAKTDTVAKIATEKPVINKEEAKAVTEVVKKDTVTKIITENPAINKEEAKAVTEVAKTDTVTKIITENPAINKEEAKAVKEVVKTDTVKPVAEVTKVKDVKPELQITKLLSANTAEGTEMIYVDLINGKPDTVIVFIPAQKDMPTVKAEKRIDEPNNEKLKIEKPKIEEQKEQEAKVQEVKVQDPQLEELKTEGKKVDPNVKDVKFIDITLPNPNAKADTGIKQIKPWVVAENKKDTIAILQKQNIINPDTAIKKNQPQVIAESKKDTIALPQKQQENTTKPVLANSDCKNLATEDDFLKLRKKMAAEITEDDMIDVAKKVFKTKCFTTIQVKNLCVLFLNDEGKYKFFDAAYPFVSDSYNFGSLQALLTDNYFITRFKAMVRH
jgi:hypothetical protein